MLTGQIKQFWLESGCVYGYRKIHLDLRDTGQRRGLNRVWRLMKRAGIKAQVGYRSPWARKGEASIVAPNRLQRQFNPDAPDERWVTDITYIRTHEGCLYRAVVVDLFSRKVIGWSMPLWMTKDIVLNALLMAVWPRNRQRQALIHSDQGSQYTSHEWQSFLKSHGLKESMSRRGNCHAIFLITSKCFITAGIGMVRAIRCHRQNTKISIINGSDVSRLSEAIQSDYSLEQQASLFADYWLLLVYGMQSWRDNQAPGRMGKYRGVDNLNDIPLLYKKIITGRS